MIGCKCGGFTHRKAERAQEVSLRWQQCGACGRCDLYELRLGRAVVSKGQAARRTWRKLAT